nr:hypothetical protein [uncultured Pseudomonas sp.]
MVIENFLSRVISGNGLGALELALPSAFTVAALGPYPLCHYFKLPESDLGGELQLAFKDISFAPVSVAAVESGTDKRQFKVTLNASLLNGRYQLYCLQSPEVTMDTGGLMGRLPAFNAEEPPMTEEQYFRFVQLEQQRNHLNQTANGRLLVDEYNRHNDAYHHVYTTNEFVRLYWEENGTSEEMGEYTSEALKSGDVVNPKDRGFGSEGVSYNSNAFQQQIWLALGCELAGYVEAGKAALNFSEVVNETGNSSGKSAELTGQEIYNAVESSSLSQKSLQTSPRTVALMAALKSIATSQIASDTDLEFCKQLGYTLDAHMCQRLRAVYQGSLSKDSAKPQLALHSDTFEIALERSEFDYVLTEQPDGALTLKLKSSTFSIPEMGLLSGTVYEQVKADTRFIRGLLVDRIASQLTRTLRALARQQE